MSDRHYQRRLRAERRFAWYGRLALWSVLTLVLLLLATLFWRGGQGFMQVEARLPVMLTVSAGEDPAQWRVSQFLPLVRTAVANYAPENMASETGGTARTARHRLLSDVAAALAVKRALAEHPDWQNTTHELWLPASGMLAEALKHGTATLTSPQQAFVHALQAEARLRNRFDSGFFAEGDSRTPEHAGMLGAAIGSLLTLAVCLLLAFPLGVATAVYLEEFAPKHWLVDALEVNINNLAAVPSIVFGLLGLVIYINVLGLPRSSPLVAGLTLALLILPVIIIATRAALRAVPGTIRQAALALGASPMQAMWHQTLPLAVPGIMTGAILGVARALGETAPLLMIGMVAFVADLPASPLTTATVMPVQIYLWAASPEAGFAEKTAAGICVLLLVLLALNATAIYIRCRFEIRW